MGFERGGAGPPSCCGFLHLAAALSISSRFRWSFLPPTGSDLRTRAAGRYPFLAAVSCEARSPTAAHHCNAIGSQTFSDFSSLGGLQKILPDRLIDRQWDRRAKYVVRIVVALGFDQPHGVAAIALRRALDVVRREQIGISARKRHRVEPRQRGARPLPVSAFAGRIRAVGAHRQNFDEHVLAAKPERG